MEPITKFLCSFCRTGQYQVCIIFHSRTNYTSRHKTYTQRCNQRIHHLLTLRLANNHQIASTCDIFVKILLFLLVQSLFHLCYNQNIDVFRYAFFQSHFGKIKSLIYQCITEIISVSKHTVRTFADIIYCTFAMSLQETDFREVHNKSFQRSRNFRFSRENHIVIKNTQECFFTVVFQLAHQSVMLAGQVYLRFYLLGSQKHFRIQIIDFHHFLGLLFHRQVTLFLIGRNARSIIIVHILHFHVRFETNILLKKLQILIHTCRQTNPEILVQQIDISCHFKLAIHLSDYLLAIGSQRIQFCSGCIIIAFESRTRSDISKKQYNSPNTQIFSPGNSPFALLSSGLQTNNRHCQKQGYHQKEINNICTADHS